MTEDADIPAGNPDAAKDIAPLVANHTDQVFTPYKCEGAAFMLVRVLNDDGREAKTDKSRGHGVEKG